MAGFFPPEYQTFAHHPGDVFAELRSEKYAVMRILTVDRFDIPQGGTIRIANQLMTATANDRLLVVGCALGGPEFKSVEEARTALRDGRWMPKIGHVPRRTAGMMESKIFVDNVPVQEDELRGYREWRQAFERGEVGIF